MLVARTSLRLTLAASALALIACGGTFQAKEGEGGSGGSAPTTTGGGGSTTTATGTTTGTGTATGTTTGTGTGTTTGTGTGTATGTTTGTGTGTGTGTSTGTTTGTGPGGECGGFVGTLCPEDAFCDFGDDLCGGNDGGGTCSPRPSGCPDLYAPVCGCDGEVYGNSCDANAAGVDVSNLGGCVPPPGLFPCGPGFCFPDQYCQRSTSDVAGFPDGYACMPLPAECENGASCECLAGEPCGWFSCEEDAYGGLTLICPGG